MARILIATSPIPGHVAPVTALARRLVARGNDVVWYTGGGFADQVTATGARHEPIRHSHDWSLVHPHDALPALRAKTGMSSPPATARRSAGHCHRTSASNRSCRTRC
jgi:UDP:flavonoid glycosyltransferase YjiC (YdhE family)